MRFWRKLNGKNKIELPAVACRTVCGLHPYDENIAYTAEKLSLCCALGRQFESNKENHS